MKHPNPVQAPVLDVKIDKGTKLINASKALFIQGNGKYSCVWFISGERLETRQPLRWYEEQLPEPLFCRCHDSYIVNCAGIHCKSGDRFVPQGNVYVKISRKYRNHALAVYKRFVMLHSG